MNPTQPEMPAFEADSRFPSGPWTGYFLQASLPGRNWMELILTFRQGILTGEGRDRVGDFLIKGRYHVEDGKCSWTKTYIKKHTISYRGFNEGKGIWGTWQQTAAWKGGFHIWPVAMGDPTLLRLEEEFEEPASIPTPEPITAEPVGLPAEVGEPVA
jgi:hypothetical protein